MRTWLAGLVALLLTIATASAPAQQPVANPRIALVVGEQTYPDETLATTANDAGLMAQTLEAAGFDVTGARDLGGASLRAAFSGFLDKAAAAGPDMQAFVYFAGRGVQYAGDNYLVPVDATLARDAQVPIEAIRAADFVHALATLPGRARIVVLDAARAAPYATSGAPLAPGLALVDPEPGVLIAFNATPGTLAGDEQGPYGVYGKTLAGAIRQGGLDIAEAFDQTRVLVNQETQGALLPWSASKLEAPYYVFERAADAPAPPVASAIEQHRQPMTRYPVDEAYAVALERDTMAGYREFLAAYPHSDQARRVRAILAARREAAFWLRTRDADSPRAYWTYLRVYPRGPHVADARRRLTFLSAAYEPPADFEPIEFAGLPPPQPDETFYVDRPFYTFDDFGPPPPPPPPIYALEDDDDWRALPPPPPPPDVGVLPVLEVAIPVMVGAVAYQGRHHWRHDGVAPPGTPVFAPPPPAPPPLPPGVTPVAPPPSHPIVSGGGAPPRPVVRPLPPMAQAPSPQGPAPGAGHPPAQPGPVAPAAGAAPNVAPGGKPPSPVTQPANPAPVPAAGGAPSAAPAKPAPAAQPAPVAPPPAAPAPAPAAPAKPAPAAQPAPAAPPPVAPAPAPAVHASPAPAPAAPAPVVHPPPAAPAPAPAVHATPAPAPAPPAPVAPPPAASAPAPAVHAPPAPAPAPPAPVFHPAPAAPAPAPAAHAPPAPAPAPPAPVVHPAPAAPAPAPAVHAPPAPAPAPPAPVFRPAPAAPAPAPAMHAPQGDQLHRPSAPGQPGAPHPPGQAQPQ